MPVIIDYVLKLSICLAVVYLFYQLFLRRLTFYNWNRWYLLGYSLLSFIIPLINIMPELQKKELDQNALVQLIPVFGFVPADASSFLESLTTWDWVLLIAALGSLVLLVRFLIMFGSFLRVKRKAQLISDDRTRIYQLDEDMRPFSFGNAIFINTELHSGEELEEIIRHEFVHVKQKHTLDIIWSELLCILLWFNPFVWLLRKNIKQNLEFLADKQVLQNGMDKKEYQYLLLKVMGNKQFAFTNHFNFSSLKNRIAMMNTIKSAKVHLTKFLFLLPVVAVLLLSFRNEVKKVLHPDANNPTERHQNGDFGKKVWETVGNASSPVWVVDGIPVVVSASGMAYFNSGEISGPDDFKVWIDNKIVSMIAANRMANRFRVFQVGASPRFNAIKNFGVNANLLLIATNKQMAELMNKKMWAKASLAVRTADTIPQRTNLKLEITNAPGGQAQKNSTNISLSNKKDRAHPLIIVDGVEQDNSDEALSKLTPDDIQSVSVLKDAAAANTYGDKGKDGVVEIVTKAAVAEKGKPAVEIKDRLQGKVAGVTFVPANTIANNAAKSSIESSSAVTIASGQDFSTTKPGIALRGAVASPPPLYVVDGTIAKDNVLKEIDPQNIQSISVLKDAASRTIYGEAARNGVVLITTKAGTKPAKEKIDVQEITVKGYGTKPQKSPEQTLKLVPVEVKGYKREANSEDKKETPPDAKSEKPLTHNFTPAKIYKFNLAYTATVKPEQEAVAKNDKPAEVKLFKSANGQIEFRGKDFTMIADTIVFKKN